MKSCFVLSLFLFDIGGYGPAAMAQTAGTFRATGSMTTARFAHTATLLLDGRVLIVGGIGDSPNFYITVSAEIYDPATGTFVATGNLTGARNGHSATLLPDGRVLIAGGFGPLESTKSGGCPLPSSCGPVTSSEIYDPSRGTFTVTGDTIYAGPAVLLPNGKVFILGYTPFLTTANAQLYDPSRGTFSATPAKTRWRSLVTLLANGQVLLTGTSEPESLPGDVYDPDADTFSPTGGPTPASTTGPGPCS